MLKKIANDLKEYVYYLDNDVLLLHGDINEILIKLPPNFVNLIFADPPYFLSNGGFTCKSGEMVSVNKGDWDTGGQEFNEKHTFNMNWLKNCKHVLASNGSIWVSGTLHNIFSVGVVLEQLDYKILNNITWYKPNASPNLSCRYFTHSTETLIWAKKDKKSKHTFNYEVMKEMNEGKQMRDVWKLPTTKKSEKEHGHHPTQKPLALLERVILASSNSGDIVMDVFNGSGTTGVVAKQFNRKYIGIDIEAKYLDLTIKRIKEPQQLILEV